MNNFISIVNNFNLVIYTDENSSCYIDTKENPRIKIIIKPLDQFYNYKYKDKWIKNHVSNLLLKNAITWEVNMLWNEKIWFVNETIQNKYFDSELYGWCDIGYFRNRIKDIPISQLSNWPCENKLNKLSDKINDIENNIKNISDNYEKLIIHCNKLYEFYETYKNNTGYDNVVNNNKTTTIRLYY